MNVRVITPTEVVLDQEAAHVTVEDPTGSLGVRPRHAPLVTPLVPGILIARDVRGSERYVAVNGGVMTVNDDLVQVATRQAVVGEDLARLEETVVAEFERETDQDKTNHVAFERLRIRFMRSVLEVERAGEKL